MNWEPGKPSRNEDEYFAKRDADWIRERRSTLDAERAAREKADANPNCPRDGAELEQRDFKNVKVDFCPKCKGVWFDGGELEMILHMPRTDVLRIVSTIDSTKGR